MQTWNVSLKCCESSRHILHRHSKNNKLLHWYVSITGLSKKSQQLQGCKCVMDMGKWVFQSSSCSSSSCTSQVPSVQVAPPRGPGESSLGSQGLSVPQPCSTLRALLITAERQESQLFFLKSIRSKYSKPAVMLTLMNWQLFWNYPAVENSLCFFFEIRT